MNYFCIDGQDNDSYAFRDYPVLTENQKVHQGLVADMSNASHQGIHRCGKCNELTSKWDEPLSGLVIKKRKYDISMTYDGMLIVSEMFKSVYTSNILSGLIFRQLPDDPRFFAVNAVRAVEFDAERRRTRFIKPCAECGRYESVVGATPVFLKAGSNVKGPEFVRTDLEFGSGDEKHPILICGQVAAKALFDAKLKGMDLIPIDGDVVSNV